MNLEGLFSLNTLLLNSEYKILYDTGGDGLVAFFATIRAKKKGMLITIRCNERLTGVITRISGLSRNTVKKYLPEIERLGLVKAYNGGLMIRGRKWSGNNLPRLRNRKLIPIKICEKFTDTKTSSFFVRVHSNIRKQELQITKGAERIKLLEQHQRGLTRNLRDLKKVKRMLKKGVTLSSLKNSHRSNSTLSNQRFLRLKKDVHGSKSGGMYHKKKLINMGLIEQSRNAFLFLEGVFSWTYLYDLRNSTEYGGFFMGSKGIYFEDSPTIVLGCSSRYKKKTT